MSKSTYQTLREVNVSHLVKSKNGFNYLSWASALDEILKLYPDTSWDVREWDGVPYLQTKAGCFVEVSVTVNTITRKQLHPILDYRNKPIPSPDVFQVNSSIQRALAKCIALHGLGLYIFQGEDLPLSEKEAIVSAREDLTSLLKENNKFSAEAARAISKMSYDDLMIKIAEYRGKNEPVLQNQEGKGE